MYTKIPLIVCVCCLLIGLFSFEMVVGQRVTVTTAFPPSQEEPPKEMGQGPRIELIPMMGFHLGGKLTFFEGVYNVSDGLNYGGVLSVQVRPDVYGELSYSRMDTKARFDYFRSGKETLRYDLSVDYFQLGARRVFGEGKAKPFGLVSMGATWFNSKDKEVEDEWRFSMAVGAGVQVDITDRVGVRFQGRLLMPMYFEGVGLHLGVGSGGPAGGLTLASSEILVQGDFSFGLVFRLDNN